MAIPHNGNGCLFDGTKISDLVDLEEGYISARTISDSEIYQLEIDRIFAKS